MTNDLILKIKELEEKIRILEFENSDWTDRAEDIYLFATTSESISNLTEKPKIFDTVLESISVIKNIPYCAFGEIVNNALQINFEYASFCECESVAELIPSDDIIGRLLNNNIIIENIDSKDSKLICKFCTENFSPTSFIIIPFSNIKSKKEVLICFDNSPKDRLESLQNTLQHVIAILNSKMDNLFLLEKLSEQKDLLELKVNLRTKELLKAKEEAEKSNHLKSEFLAQMSHEIRTPINTMLNFINLIEISINNLDPDLEDSFNIIYTSGKRITRTIDLILNMSEIQTGTYEYIPKEIDLFTDIFEKLEKEFLPVTKKKGIDLIVRFNSDLQKIIADEYSIFQIFSNLIDNAIKYTKKGNVIINIIRNVEDRIIVEVSDTGIGIDEEYLPLLFDAFTQESHGYTRSFEGNGLGLALVKRYCEINKINVEVESKKGVGSTFRIIF